MRTIGRRKFFSKISFGTIGALLLSIFPLNILSKRKHNLPEGIKVKIHPNSVRRNK